MFLWERERVRADRSQGVTERPGERAIRGITGIQSYSKVSALWAVLTNGCFFSLDESRNRSMEQGPGDRAQISDRQGALEEASSHQ